MIITKSRPELLGYTKDEAVEILNRITGVMLNYPITEIPMKLAECVEQGPYSRKEVLFIGMFLETVLASKQWKADNEAT